MKKVLIGLVVVLAVAWAGAVYFVGSKAEQWYTAELAQVDLLPSQPGLRFQAQDYQRGFLSSQGKVCLVAQGELAASAQMAAMSEKLCFLVDVQHGPIVSTEQGMALALIAQRAQLDTGNLPDELKAMLNEAFANAAPVTLTSLVGFDESMSGRFAIAPAKLESPMGSMALETFYVDYHVPLATAYPAAFSVVMEGLQTESPQGGLSVPSLTGSVRVDGVYDDALPLSEAKFQANGVTVTQQSTPMASFDLVLQGDSRVDGDLVSSQSGLWVENLQSDMLPVPIDSVYFGMEFDDLKGAALIRINDLSNEIDELQAAMLMGSFMGMDSEEIAQKAQQIEALSLELGRVAAEELVVPGKSRLATQLLLDNGSERQLTIDADARYLGRDGDVVPMSELASGSSDMFKSLLHMKLHAKIEEAIAMPPTNTRLDQMVEQGLAEKVGTAWQLMLSSEAGELTLNGESISAEELESRLNALRTPVAGTVPPELQGMEEMQEIEIQ